VFAGAGTVAASPPKPSHTATAIGRPALSLDADPHYCDGCTPPLDYAGGPVMDINAAVGLTIAPIYWAPAGTDFTFPANYEAIVNGYVANIAASSGQSTNVYSIDAEYYQKAEGATSYANYSFKAGSAIVDTAPFPKDGCTPASGYTACITDQQLREELVRLTHKMSLVADLAHVYPVFFPPGVEVADRDGSTSDSSFCGYHRAFMSGSEVIAYANIPYKTTGCDAGQAPNGLLSADTAVDTLSHEINESVTDPEGDNAARLDAKGNEIGDICGSTYGPPLGSTDPSHPKSTEYNQVINGGKYYTQTEFSNLAYSKLGVGQGCVQSEALTQHLTATTSAVVSFIFVVATPTRLPADGSTTSSLWVSVGDSQGFAVPGDPVSFQTYTRSGKGHCGKLSKSEVHTDDGGIARLDYTASTSEVECQVVAVEADGGRSASAVIYQGLTRSEAPTIDAHFPTELTPGAPATTFTVAMHNPSDKPVPATRLDFTFFPGTSAPPVLAPQLHLSRTPPQGRPVPSFPSPSWGTPRTATTSRVTQAPNRVPRSIRTRV
jgi:hypothetical protein